MSSCSRVYSSGLTFYMSRSIPSHKAKDLVSGREVEIAPYRMTEAAGRCGLFNPLSGITTTIRFSGQTLPYLGIWINEGGWNGYYNAGIEPSTCILDDPVSAAKYGKDSMLPPRGTVEWDISIEIELNPS